MKRTLLSILSSLVLFTSAVAAPLELDMAKNSSGVTQQHRKDTLRVDGKDIIGVAVPVTVQQIQGDLNFSGSVSTADIVALVQRVFFNKPLPMGDTLGYQFEYGGKHWFFLPWNGIR